MSRPMKWRKVCCLPENKRFGPLDDQCSTMPIITMSVDEYEAVRLIDLEDMTQEECAAKMHVARTTVQGIYTAARKKIADLLVNGKVLQIEGGEYRLCEGVSSRCGKGCHRRKLAKHAVSGDQNIGEVQMLLAIPVETDDMDAAVCVSFGRAPFFLLYNPKERSSVLLENHAASAQGGAGIKAAQALVDSGAGVLLTPRCGENAAEVLRAADIAIYKTTEGSIAENIALFEEGKLAVLEEIHAGFHKHGAV